MNIERINYHKKTPSSSGVGVTRTARRPSHTKDKQSV